MHSRDPVALVDKDGQVIVMLAGSPKDREDRCHETCAKCCDAMAQAHQDYHEEADPNKRRGEHRCITCRISSGGGQTVCACVGVVLH